jgi:hypothetical protein
MSPEREKEYVELSGYVHFFATVVWGIPPSDPSHPCNSNIAERYGRSRALQGYRQAANDTIEALAGKPVEAIRLLDEGLRNEGLLTFSEVSRRYGRTLKRILKRGRLSSETEWYLATGALGDPATQLAESERATLERASADFEAAVTRNRP